MKLTLQIDESSPWCPEQQLATNQSIGLFNEIQQASCQQTEDSVDRVLARFSEGPIAAS